MFFSFSELVDVVVMCLALGFIFKDFFRVHAFNARSVQHKHDPLAQYNGQKKLGKFGAKLDFSGFKFAILVTAPAIILHELGHKVVALAYGMQATFHAAYGWLGIGILLKLMNFGFIFFVPAYVSISGRVSPLEHSLIAFAGPAVNLSLFLICLGILKNKDVMKICGKKYKRWIPAIVLTKRINMFLFIFNMLPIPMFDGFKVYEGLVKLFL